MSLLAASMMLMLTPDGGYSDPAIETCLAGDDSTDSLNQCWNEAIQRADEALAASYGAALAGLGGETSEAGGALAKEQQLWVAFQQESCSLYWSSTYGSLHRAIIGPSCRHDVIVARINQLRRIAEEASPEGA